MSELRHEILWRPAYDKRPPESPVDYGIHGMEVEFRLHGPKATICFVLYSGWLLPKTIKKLTDSHGFQYSMGPSGAYISAHADEACGGASELADDVCDVRGKGHRCYQASWYVAAKDAYAVLVSEGIDALWAHLGEYYKTLEAA